MGVTGRWIRALVGLKASEKRHGSRKDVNSSIQFTDGKIYHKRRNSADTERILDQNCNVAAEVEEGCSQFIHDTSTSLSSHEIDDVTCLRKQWAATQIQTNFRGFLARRALRALKGLVKLQALVRGHAVRKQAAKTLGCMQVSVRVQDHVHAGHVRSVIKYQTMKQKPRANEARVGEVENGWCDTAGSVEEVKARLIKRKEAAAKRERAIAYALSHQWQVGKRWHVPSHGLNPETNSWGWDWLQRWMAVRPWENRLLGTNARKNESTPAGIPPRNLLWSPMWGPPSSGTRSNGSNQKMCPAFSDVGSSSSSSLLEPGGALSSKGMLKRASGVAEDCC